MCELTCNRVDSIEGCPVRIIVVEDFALFREFICKELAKNPNLQVICEIPDGLQAVQKAKEIQFDLILLDIGLPNLNGMAVARQILKLAPESKIIIVSQESSPDVVEEALSLGVLGYVLKTGAATDLLTAINAVLEGRIYVSSESP
jgi:DNA-binding NarL/FixJ family response regulator